MSKKNIRSTAIISLSVLCAFALVHSALAADPTYKPMVSIPGFNDQNSRTLSEYVNLVYLTLVSLGALLALIKISIAGAKYMMSDVVTSKGEAKSDIKGALLGLAILVIPYIVLNTIYSGLTKTNILDGDSPKAALQQTGGVAPVGNSQPPGSTSVVCAYKLSPCPAGSFNDLTGSCDAPQTYDDTLCRSNCSTLNGSFTPRPDGQSGTCTY